MAKVTKIKGKGEIIITSDDGQTTKIEKVEVLLIEVTEKKEQNGGRSQTNS